MKCLLPLSVTAAALLLPDLAAAQSPSPTPIVPNAQDLSTTRSLAMGDAFRAVASSNEAIYFNLAGMAQGPRYEFDLVYAFNDETGLDLYNGSIVDAKSTTFATGLAYSRIDADRLDGHVVNLGFGLPLGDRASIGFGLKYLNFGGASPDDTNAVTGDLGLLLRPVDILSVGVATYNVVGVASREAPRQVAFGAAVGTDTTFRLASDVVLDFSGDETGLSYHAGAEYLLLGAIPLRAGFKRLDFADRQGDYASFGLGYVSPEFGLEAAYVQNVKGALQGDRTFSFSFKMFL
jgi:hypothetical protein